MSLHEIAAAIWNYPIPWDFVIMIAAFLLPVEAIWMSLRGRAD